MPQRVELNGHRFGRLTVIRRVSSNAQGRIYECRCDCGQVKQVAAHYLRNGHTKSCGCLSRELAKAHGVARRKWAFPNPKCNVEGCPRQGQNLWQRLHPRAMAVKGTGGEQTVTIYNFHCAQQKPARSLHSEYVGPHGEPAKHIATGQFIFTDSTTGLTVETESSRARAMADPATREKLSKASRRRWKKDREAMMQAVRKSAADPARRAKIGAASRQHWADPEARQKHIAGRKAFWASLTPAQRQRQLRHQMRGFRTPEAIARKSEGLKRAWDERKARLAALLKAAAESLPPDWKKRLRTWRIAGMLLLEKDHMTNRELASAMDELGVRCPHGKRAANGTRESITWVEYFEQRGGELFAHRVRQWVNRPG